MSTITRLSPQGARDVVAHEGFVSRAYRDPVGVLTIGTGYTNRSKVFRGYWIATRGRQLKPGDTITREECLKILPKIVDEEYGAAVVRHIRPKFQHHYDGAASVCFNLGPGAATWKWAKALAAGDAAGSAALLRKTGTTAGGRRLPGLVKRRQAEALLVQRGIYATSGAIRVIPRDTVASTASDELLHYQAILARLGHYDGALDGLAGPRTTKAVRAFQSGHPHLKVDGLLGPATAAALERAAAARESGTATGVAGLVSGAGLAAALGGAPEWVLWIAGGSLALAAIGGMVFAWRYRDEIRHRMTGLLKQRATA
ncbi:glycoside hydrolase family protein [Polymorphum gilvum]|uniref:Lysozyme n=1 Tax=Polymorphum gilvum (strain LMG 25793 / CGMCC 1.9160 / SL003B-26A1) TaxID=991905 RepID=F2J654_POLGS|nr:peptidoglycan-binding protein [Polymorphum gilvum]ADZ72418.1 Lysozyme [Polymorphum gilvum SL003B-26A1]